MKKSNNRVWLDGRIVSLDGATVPIFSHAVGRGSAIFEVMTCHATPAGPMLFRPQAYIRRLRNSARLVGMKLPYASDELLQAIKTAVKANNVSKAIIKIIALWPAVEFEVLPSDPKLSVAIIAFNPEEGIYRSRRIKFDELLVASTVAIRKLDPRTVPVEAKVAANYLNAMLARREALKKGADVPIMLDVHGYLSEGATESLFLVHKGKLFTPRLDNILPGITRDSVLKIARRLKIPSIEKRLMPEKLKSADEIFFTTSPMKIWPASHLNGRRIGNGLPGPITTTLRSALAKIIRGDDPSFSHWLVPVCV